jgi:hypothetical protein
VATLLFRLLAPALPEADNSGGKLSPLLNWLVLPETERRPALILGTSSDWIGATDGQSFYATFSKNLKRETGLPIAPYAGVAYGTHEHLWLPLAGLNTLSLAKMSSDSKMPRLGLM